MKPNGTSPELTHPRITMAEPISLAASIITFLELSTSISQFIGEVKGAAKNIHTLSEDIEAMESLLLLLEQFAHPRKTWLGADAKAAGNRPLEQYRRLLDLLKKKLKPLSKNRVVAALLWPFKKREIKEILDSVERQKVAFMLALQNEQLSVAIAGIRTHSANST